jgi:hypothetical protein
MLGINFIFRTQDTRSHDFRSHAVLVNSGLASELLTYTAAGFLPAGEFGSALVYLHEIGPCSRQGFTGAIGFASATSGCMLGVLVVVIVEAIFNRGKCNKRQISALGCS